MKHTIMRNRPSNWPGRANLLPNIWSSCYSPFPQLEAALRRHLAIPQTRDRRYLATRCSLSLYPPAFSVFSFPSLRGVSSNSLARARILLQSTLCQPGGCASVNPPKSMLDPRESLGRYCRADCDACTAQPPVPWPGLPVPLSPWQGWLPSVPK